MFVYVDGQGYINVDGKWIECEKVWLQGDLAITIPITDEDDVFVINYFIENKGYTVEKYL